MVILRFKRTLDGDATLTLIRPDGSTAWTPIGPADGIGPMHALAHVVVERQLMLIGALLGRVSRGDAFTGFDDTSAGRIGPDAVRGEAVASLLSLEAMTGRPLALEAFNDAVQERCVQMRPGYHAPDLTPTALHALRSEFASLRREWDMLEPGAALDLRFGAVDTMVEPIPSSVR
jgi:hypothetical protein